MERASDIIAMIPDVKPKVAMRVLKEAILDGAHGYQDMEPSDRRLALREGWVLTISPIGGRVLLELFEAGKIPQNSKNASRDVAALRDYAAQEDAHRERVKQAEEAAAAYLRRIEEIAENPDCADPSEITADLIDKVFLKRFGLRHYGDLQIAGLSCHKRMTPGQLSNSGKTRDPAEIYCYWFDAQGNRCGQVPVEMPKNRRNDPERNWGLGRE